MLRTRIKAADLEALKARIPLRSLIGESVALRRETQAEFTGLCPFHIEDTPSFRVYRDHAHCFGCGWHGDAISWLMERERMSFAGAIRHLREWSGTAPLKSDDVEVGAHRKDCDWLPIMPVPSDAPALIVGGAIRAFNPKRQGTSAESTRWRPTLSHPYRNSAGDLLGYVFRVEFWRDGERKKFTPAITFCRHVSTMERRWCVVPMTPPRSLYALDQLAAAPGASVVVVEGEKAADAARRLLPQSVVMTWAGGAKAYHLTNWLPLRGRRVVGIPDADTEGRAAFGGRVTSRGKRVAGLLELWANLGIVARYVEPPFGLADGWDLADALAEGWDTARTLGQLSCA